MEGGAEWLGLCLEEDEIGTGSFFSSANPDLFYKTQELS